MDSVVIVVLLCVIMSYGYSVNETTPQPQNSTESEVNRSVTLRAQSAQCTEESKVDPTLISKLRARKWKRVTSTGGLINERKKESLALKKWALCVLVKSGMMSRDGVLKQDVVLARVPEKDKNKVEKVIDECLFQKSHAPIDIAWYYIRCVHYRYPKYSII